MLSELEPVAAAELPLAELRDHLRLGTGFADEAVQDPILEAVLRAALAAVEARTGRALIARGFAWRVGEWRDPERAVLPLAPVEVLSSAEIEDAGGERRDVAGRLILRRPAGARPVVTGRGGCLPRIPVGGTAVIVFAAGFGPWAAVPADLRQAVLTLAAALYEDRGGMETREVPPLVAALLAPWRIMRLRTGSPR